MTIETRLRIGLSAVLLVLSAVMLTGQQPTTFDQSFEWLKQRVLPEVPKLLTPADGQAQVPVNAGLTFRALGAESCDIEAGAYPTGTPSTMPGVANAVPCGTFAYPAQLASATRYCWRARGRNIAGVTPFSATSCFTTSIAACVPVHCVQSPFVFTSGTWGACINGQETRSELWTRNVITPANSCGTQCGPATEQRTSVRPCTIIPPPTSGLAFSGLVRDAVQGAETPVAPGGGNDGSFTVSLPASKTITNLRLGTSGGVWDTVAGNGNWVVGAALTAAGPLVNAANSTVNFTASAFSIFAADVSPSFFGAGKVFTLTITYSDSTTTDLTTTIGGTTAPVNCAGTWSAWTPNGACANNQQPESRSFTVTTPASNGGTACPASPETRTVAATCAPPPTGNVITLAPATVYQTMRGWEVVAQAEQDFQPVRFPIYGPKVFDEAVALGIDRIRVEVRSGSENPTDYWAAALAAGMTGPAYDAWRANRYVVANDNSDPNVINAAGFKWTEYNRQVDTLVNPLRTRMIARGESLYVVITYVSFGSVNIHHNTPAEYAEFMLSLFQQSQARYGWVPNAIELWLEPDNVSGANPTNLGQMIVAAGARLLAAGFKPDFIAPSTTNMTTALTWTRDYLLNVPNVKTYLKEIAYHRYSGVSTASLQGIANLAQAQGLSTSMLECWVYQGSSCVNNPDVLHEDLKVGRASAWEQSIIAGTGGGYGTLLWVDAANNVTHGPLTRYAQQYYRHVRRGARRIGATSSAATFDPLAFINTDGKHVVVVKASAAGTFAVSGLPAGTYGCSYTTASAQTTCPDVAGGSGAIVTIPAAGVLTVFSKVAGPAVPVDCIVSSFALSSAGAWSACAAGQQTRSEAWARTIVTPASNGGAACPVLTEPRTGTQPCGVPPPSTRTLVTSADLRFKGYVKLPDVSGSGYTTASFFIRYVNGERRLVMAHFTNTAASGRIYEDLVEYRFPTTLPITGTPADLIEVRRWAADWTLTDATPTMQDAASTMRLGGLYWDEPNSVLYYTIFGYYSGANKPFMGATKLLDAVDTVRGGTYRQVGQKYGPWWYVNNSTNPSDPEGVKLHMKKVSQALVPIPLSSQADFGGRTMLACSNPGSIASQGHLGPGCHAINLPPVTQPANTVIPLGLRVMDYSPDSPTTPLQHARRDTGYTPRPSTVSTSTGLEPGGYWQMNLDQVNGFAWVETATKEGFLTFGRRVFGRVSYGPNPHPEFADTTLDNPKSQYSYLGEFFEGAIYRTDPKEMREVGRGLRVPWNTGINPTNIGNWKALWPVFFQSTRPIDVAIGASLIWDAIASELIWCNPQTVGGSGARPACHVWSVTVPTTPIGINMSEAEYSWGSFPSQPDLDFAKGANISLIRLPVAWERLQPTLYSPLAAAYANALKAFITLAGTEGMQVIVDIHNCGRYNLNWQKEADANGGIVASVCGTATTPIGSAAVPISAFVDLWSKLATHLRGTPGLAYYGLMNEPNNMGAVNVWPDAAQAAIHAIRAVDTTTTILLPGTTWSSAYWWPTSNPTLHLVTDPANNMVFEAHLYFDRDGGGRYLETYDQQGAHPNTAVDNVQPFLGWLKQHNAKGFIGEFGIPDDDPRWLTVLDNFLTAIQAAGVFGTYWEYLYHSPNDPPWWPPPHEPMSIQIGHANPQMAVIRNQNVFGVK